MSQHVIGFSYILKDKEGKVLESSAQGKPIFFLEGTKQIIPHLENELVNLKKGDKKEITVPYQAAYGPYDPNQVYKVARSKFPTGITIKEGDMFEIGKDNNRGVVTVIELGEAEITLDVNHPLAGQDLAFDVEIMEHREATSEEILHGHVHGQEGQHS